jgi:hypothetical protein
MLTHTPENQVPAGRISLEYDTEDYAVRLFEI